MTPIRATWRNGQIVPDRIPDWPEGTRLEIVEPLAHDEREEIEAAQADDPESIREWIEELDKLPKMPPMTEADVREWQQWEEWRKIMKAVDKEAVRKQFEGSNP